MTANTHNGMLDLVRSIVRRANLRPSDLKVSEHFDVIVEHDNGTDGFRVMANRADGYSSDCRWKSEAVVISWDEVERASMVRGDRGIVEVVLDELDHLMLRMRHAVRPPKGWRLFGRRPRAVFA